MSEVLTGIVLNGIQHIITIVVGMAAVFLGYRLFIEMPRRREGDTKLDLPGGVGRAAEHGLEGVHAGRGS